MQEQGGAQEHEISQDPTECRNVEYKNGKYGLMIVDMDKILEV